MATAILEVWNIVFMQFNRLADGTMEKRLQAFCRYSGMGLERMTAVMQHVNSNYETDIFQTLIKEVATLLNVKHFNKSLRRCKTIFVLVLSDCRWCFLPSNEGRGW